MDRFQEINSCLPSRLEERFGGGATINLDKVIAALRRAVKENEDTMRALDAGLGYIPDNWVQNIMNAAREFQGAMMPLLRVAEAMAYEKICKGRAAR